MENFKDSIWSYLKEKTSTPLLTNILISWILWNWKVVLILFFNNATSDSKLGKITEIERVTNFCLSFIFPLISAGIITYIFPIINKIVFEYLEQREIEKVNFRTKLNESKRLYSSLEYKDLTENNRILERDLLDSETLINESNKKKFNAESRTKELELELKKRKELEFSYTYEQQFLVDAIENYSDLGIKFDINDTCTCFRKQTPYYYTFRKIEVNGTVHNIFTMVNHQFFNIDFRIKSYLIVEILEGIEGKKYNITIIGAQGPDFNGIREFLT